MALLRNEQSKQGSQLTLLLVMLALFFISFSIGRYPIPLDVLCKMLLSKIIPIKPTWPETMETVFFHVRLPRILAAMLVGAGLATSGAAFQGIFKNPLVSPDILGVASGAGFGAALAILFFEGELALQVFAVFFGVIAVFISYSISRFFKGAATLVLILAGIIVGSFFQALLSFLKYVADPFDKLPTIVFWLMGSLARISSQQLFWIAPPMCVCIAILFLYRWRINILSLGENEARALGVNTSLERGLVIFLCTMISSLAVCLSGTIGWVGLVIPHMCRMLVGSDYRKLLPACATMGAAYLLLVDNIARTLSSAEIPLGMLTALIGAPFFAYLLIKGKAGWQI